ncbi:microsomal dipeptidase precursor [Trematosphaeria pertusa]|uniref:Dipeptidase n=1 Tax=Trematosphaeria pertusa TaxID=390896 RepID=A0A6A6HRR8_9PLEO|nr:microsomal dipeptidase precursor [Trematosphaeria pertusa]KAF2240579.1 microsomal dipeptidase precursor [Trematosphaeria pertusa]
MNGVVRAHFGRHPNSSLHRDLYEDHYPLTVNKSDGHYTLSNLRATPYNESLEARAEEILKDTPLIDDLAYFLRWAHSNHIYLDNFTVPWESGELGGEVDLYRLRKGRVGGTFWSIYKSFTLTADTALDETDAAIDVIQRIQAAYPTAFGRPESSSDALSIFQSGRIISPLGLEGLHMLGDSFAKLRDYHARGVRYATLTHNCHNIYADSAMTDTPNGTVQATPKWGGVSAIGQKLVLEMNRLGILVDLSHTSADTMRSVLGGQSDRNGNVTNGTTPRWEGSVAPPIFSHSSAFGLCPHPRNVPDDVLYLVKARGGIVMVTFWADFISCRWPDGVPVEGQLPESYPPNVTIAQVVRHMRYIGDLIGYDHVGIGSDFDGTPFALMGLDDVSKFPNLVMEMLRQGIEDDDVRKIVGGNLLRVWKVVDSVATAMQVDGTLPAEDDLVWLPNPWEGF